MKDVWAVSIVAAKSKGSDVTLDHCAVAIRAVSADEAMGKASRLAAKVFPECDGWDRRGVCVHSGENVIDTDRPMNFRGREVV